MRGLALVAQVQRQQATVNAGFGFDGGQREGVGCGGAHGALPLLDAPLTLLLPLDVVVAAIRDAGKFQQPRNARRYARWTRCGW